MELGELAAARRDWTPRPLWTAIFAQAFSIAAENMACLRRSYLGFPWPHFHEHSSSVATITMEREHEGEEAAFFNKVKQPHAWRLSDLDAYLRRCKTDPIESIPTCRRALRLASLPWPLRRWGMWLGLHGSGALREHYFGTFTLSSVGSDGGGMVVMRAPLTCAVHYGLFDEDHRIDMRLTFDHRVFDGAVAVRALARMEEALRGPILAELRRTAPRVAA